MDLIIERIGDRMHITGDVELLRRTNVRYFRGRGALDTMCSRLTIHDSRLIDHFLARHHLDIETRRARLVIR